MGSVKFSLIILGFCLFAAGEGEVFWRKETNYKRMLESRALLVSATTGEKNDKKTMLVIGAGIVAAPLEFTYRTVRKFERLPKVSDRFHEATFDAKNNSLHLHMSAMGYHVKMLLKLKFDEETKKKIIHWECVEGGFVGMRGKIELAQVDARRTEMSLEAQYEAQKLPLPKALMGLGLEVVAHRVAGLMREDIEKEYKK